MKNKFMKSSFKINEIIQLNRDILCFIYLKRSLNNLLKIFFNIFQDIIIYH